MFYYLSTICKAGHLQYHHSTAFTAVLILQKGFFGDNLQSIRSWIFDLDFERNFEKSQTLLPTLRMDKTTVIG